MWSVSEAVSPWGHTWQLIHTTAGVSRAVAMFSGPDAATLAARCRDLLDTFGLIPTPLPEGIDG